MSVTYTARLQAQRDHAARLADRFAMGILDGQTCIEELRQARREVEMLERQIGWIERRTGWVSPATPAWCD